jgi:hypothetical protein
MDLTPVVTSVGGTSLAWLGSSHGAGDGRTRTIDVSKLVSGTHYDAVTKVVPSGIALGKITATGLYAPWTSGATDGTQILDSFLLDSHSLLRQDGSLSTVIGVAALVHAIIRPSLLPVAAQRTITSATATTGLFSYQD